MWSQPPGCANFTATELSHRPSFGGTGTGHAASTGRREAGAPGRRGEGVRPGGARCQLRVWASAGRCQGARESEDTQQRSVRGPRAGSQGHSGGHEWAMCPVRDARLGGASASHTAALRPGFKEAPPRLPDEESNPEAQTAQVSCTPEGGRWL